MKIREAKPSDAGQIATLWNAVITDTLLTFTSATKSILGLEQDITTRGSAFLVLEQDEKVLVLQHFFSFGVGRDMPAQWSIQLFWRLKSKARGRENA